MFFCCIFNARLSCVRCVLWCMSIHAALNLQWTRWTTHAHDELLVKVSGYFNAMGWLLSYHGFPKPEFYLLSTRHSLFQCHCKSFSSIFFCTARTHVSVVVVSAQIRDCEVFFGCDSRCGLLHVDRRSIAMGARDHRCDSPSKCAGC